MTDCAWKKPVDYTAKNDKGKAKISLCPTKVFEAIARIREYGVNKYPETGKDGWKNVEIDRYIDAMLRHALKAVEDVHSLDEESGMPHIWHCACNIAFIIELMDAEEDYSMSKAEFEKLKRGDN